MSDLALRRIEDKLNTLIPKAQWLLSNYSSAGTGPCPPCVGGETTAEAAATAPVFTALDPDYWPFQDNENPNPKTLQRPEYVHFFKSQGLDKFLQQLKILAPATVRHSIEAQVQKKFKTKPDNVQTTEQYVKGAKGAVIVFTPETWSTNVFPYSEETKNFLLKLKVLNALLLSKTPQVYKPFNKLQDKMFENLQIVLQNMNNVLKSKGCQTNQFLLTAAQTKSEENAKSETETIINEARAFFSTAHGSPYIARQEARRKGIAQFAGPSKYAPFNDFEEWNWVANDLEAAKSFYNNSRRNDGVLYGYPFETFELWEKDLAKRSGGLQTTREQSLAAAKHYAEGGGVDDTYQEATLQDWNNARIAKEGPRSIAPLPISGNTDEWCKVELTNLFQNHPYVNYYVVSKPTNLPKEISTQEAKTLQSTAPEPSTNSANLQTLFGKVIYSALLNFVTTYEPLQALLPQIIAGEITEPSSCDLFATYCKQTPLPETPAEYMPPVDRATTTKKASLKASAPPPPPGTRPSTPPPPESAVFPPPPSAPYPQPPSTPPLRPITPPLLPATGTLGGMRLRRRANKSRRHKPTRRHYTKSPIRPFY